MNQKMRKFPLIFIIGVMLVSSCSMRDDNGLLGGNWRMDNEKVFLSIYTDLAQWQIIRSKEYFLGCFRHTDDSLIFTLKDGQSRGLYHNNWSAGVKDTVITQADHLPAVFEIPQNFGFRIQKLTTDSLVLQAEGRTLRFRRY